MSEKIQRMGMPDKFDYSLIWELQEDASKSGRTIARKLKTSPTTVSRRMQRLVNDRWIRITAIPNLKLMGFATNAFIGIEVRPGSLSQVCDALEAHPRVHFLGATIGRFDVIVWVLLRTPQELAEFLEEVIHKIDGVSRTETMMVVREIKRTHGWISRQDVEPLPSDNGTKERTDLSSVSATVKSNPGCASTGAGCSPVPKRTRKIIPKS